MVAEALWRSGLAEWIYQVGNSENIEVENLQVEETGTGWLWAAAGGCWLVLTGTHVFLNVTAKIYIRLCCEITKFAHC